LDSDFPRTPPKGFFLTKIYHPNVAIKGDICVNTLKRDWNPAKWSLAHILGVIRCLLIIPFPESSLNEEAGKLFMDDYEEYARMAKMMTKIHATPRVEDKSDGVNENDCKLASNEYYMDEDESQAQKQDRNIKFSFQNGSNLDASMEEEKEPLQDL
jgi:ubiquitin-conjugating enzyme E2 S